MFIKNLSIAKLFGLALNSKAQGYLAIFGCSFGFYQFFTSASQEQVLHERIASLESQLASANELIASLSAVATDIRSNQTGLLLREIESTNLANQAPTQIEDLHIFSDLDFIREGKEYVPKYAALIEQDIFLVVLMSYTKGDWGVMGTHERIYFALIDGSKVRFLPQNLFADRASFHAEIIGNTLNFDVSNTGLQPTPLPRQEWRCRYHYDVTEDAIVFDGVYTFNSNYLISGPCYIYSSDGDHQTKLSEFVYSEVSPNFLDSVIWSDAAGGYKIRSN